MKFIAQFKGARHTAELHLTRLPFAAAPTVNGGETRSVLLNQKEQICVSIYIYI